MTKRQSHRIVDVTKAAAEEDSERRAAIKEYEDLKESFAKNIQFDGKRANKSKLLKIFNQTPLILYLAENHIPYTSQYFRILVGSATYDRLTLCFLDAIAVGHSFRFWR